MMERRIGYWIVGALGTALWGAQGLCMAAHASELRAWANTSLWVLQELLAS